VGMHHGYLVAASTADRLIGALGAYAGDFTTGAPAARFEDLNLGSDDAGWNLAVGERGGKAYLIDTAFLLSDDPDLVAALSRDLGGTVVGAGAETVSGSYWFHVATDGVVRRSHWNSYDAVSEPFDRGDPLPTEADAPLEDLDGDGIMAALTDLGFDVATWSDQGPWRALTYTGERFPEVAGELDGARDAHFEAHKVDKPSKPTVVRRGDGYDIAHPSSRMPGGEPVAAAAKGGGCFGVIAAGIAVVAIASAGFLPG
jgi:hypothetical protein